MQQKNIKLYVWATDYSLITVKRKSNIQKKLFKPSYLKDMFGVPHVQFLLFIFTSAAVADVFEINW